MSKEDKEKAKKLYHSATSKTVHETKEGFLEAIKLCEKAVKLYPKNYDTWELLGESLGDTGQYNRAIEIYQKLIDINRVLFMEI